MQEKTKHYGRIVRNSRQYKGLTIKEASELCGLTPQSLNGIELGDHNPKLSSVLGIAVAFDIDLGALNDCKLPVPVDPATVRQHRRVCRYVVTRETYTDEDGNHTVYGISAVEQDDDNMTILAHAPNVSANEAAVRDLAKRCTRHHLAPIHLHDVVEDFLDSI